MTKDLADSRWGPNRWLPMPRFETIQASGKHRPIDDGKRFGHNSARGFTETIECCSAFQPAAHARALAQQAVLHGCDVLLFQQTLETGGEDMPEAYRWVPADPGEGSLNVIATWSVDDNCWLFQEMFGQVCSRAAAVIKISQDTAVAGCHSEKMAPHVMLHVLRRRVPARPGRCQRQGTTIRPSSVSHSWTPPAGAETS